MHDSMPSFQKDFVTAVSYARKNVYEIDTWRSSAPLPPATPSLASRPGAIIPAMVQGI
jgi:hypothetical protein